MGLEDDTEISWVENLHIYAIHLSARDVNFACTMIQVGNLLRILKMGIPPFNHFTPQSLGYIIIIRAPSYVFWKMTVTQNHSPTLLCPPWEKILFQVIQKSKVLNLRCKKVCQYCE